MKGINMITLTFKLPGRQKTFTGEKEDDIFRNFLKDFGEVWEDVVEVEQHNSWSNRVFNWSPSDFLRSIGWYWVDIKLAMEDL
mgnify:FL=1